jgi:excisionase family DNA binding protein
LLLGSERAAAGVSSELLTVREAAELVRVRPVTIYKLCSAGTLVHSRVSNAIRISRAALDTLLRSRARGPTPGC